MTTRYGFRRWSFLVLLAAGLVQASPRVAVLLAGDCADQELQSAGTMLWKVLPEVVGMALLDEPSMVKRIGRRSLQTFDEVQRQIEVARTDMYSGKDLRAQQQVLAALDEIQWLPFGPERVALKMNAEVLYAKILMNLGRRAEGEEAFRRVLRVRPNYRLDYINFSPSTRANFDAVRRRLEETRKSRLEVTSKPSGADVFLDGVKFGVTPLHGEVDPGTYQLVVTKGKAVSFPRAVDLRKPTTVFADLEFEGRFHLSRHACLTGEADTNRVVSNAMRLGAVLDVDRVVLVRLSGNPGEVRWLSAGLLVGSTGEVVREGRFRLLDSGQRAEVAELAGFVLKGQPARSIIVTVSPEMQEAATGAAPTPAQEDGGISLGKAEWLLLNVPEYIMLRSPPSTGSTP
ncbi:MAG: PEGA domain-containing protein [Myxococcaceae bacterium]